MIKAKMPRRSNDGTIATIPTMSAAIKNPRPSKVPRPRLARYERNASTNLSLVHFAERPDRCDGDPANNHYHPEQLDDRSRPMNAVQNRFLRWFSEDQLGSYRPCLTTRPGIGSQDSLSTSAHGSLPISPFGNFPPDERRLSTSFDQVR